MRTSPGSGRTRVESKPKHKTSLVFGGVRIAMLSAIVTAVVVTIVVTIASVIVIGLRLRAEARTSAELAERQTTAVIATAVKGVFENAFTIVNSTHDSLVHLKEEGITDPHVYDALLARVVTSGSDRFGAWYVWQAGALPLDLPALDAPALGTPADRHAAGGRTADRYETYWHQNGIEMLKDKLPDEVLASDLYKIPITSGRSYLLEPHEIDAVAGDSILVTSFSRPIESDGKIIGAMGIDLKLDAIRDALSSIEIPTGASFTVMSDGGVVAMSTLDKDAASDKLRSVSKDILVEARKGDGFTLMPAADRRSSVLRSWHAIDLVDVHKPWYVIIDLPETSFLDLVKWSHLSFLLIPLIAFVAILFTVVVITDIVIARPLRRLTDIITGLSDGLFAFQIPYLERADEIGDIARGVEGLQESREKIARLHEENGELEYARQIGRKSALDSIASRFSQSIGQVVQGVGMIATIIRDETRAVTADSETTLGRIKYVGIASATAKTSLLSVARITQFLSSAIQDIRDHTRDARIISAKVQDRAASADRAITDLQETIGRIGTVATGIRSVAGQINLIALNATIEAARAGEKGRGFAVVAQEIKLLAARTAVATDEISRYVTAVEKASQVTDSSVADMQAALREMQTVSAKVADALDLQTDATENIRGFVDTAVEGATHVEQTLIDLQSAVATFQTTAEGLHEKSDGLSRDASTLTGEVEGFIDYIRAT